MENIAAYLKNVDYPGRVILAGSDSNGKPFVLYAITGRSVNSKNRILVSENGIVRTMPYDESLLSDPSLIIYTAMKKVGSILICSNGDHTDTIATSIDNGETLMDALQKRTYEPDAPQYTPRIAVVFDGKKLSFGIIKRENEEAHREVWCYPIEKGKAHIIHTYMRDGNPLLSFSGEPVSIDVSKSNDILDDVWSSLKAEYRVAAYIKSDDYEMVRNALEE